MKTMINTREFKAAVKIALQCVPLRSQKPILQCLKLSFFPDHCEIAATNLEMSIKQRVDSVQGEAFEVVVPAKKLFDILAESPDEMIEIDADDDAEVIIKGSDSKFNVYTHLPSRYPEITDAQNGNVIAKIPTYRFQEMARQIIYAAAKDSSKYAFNGVLLEEDEGCLIGAATDGKRLNVYKSRVECKQARYIIPTPAMLLAAKLEGDSITIEENDYGIKFSDDKTSILTMTIAGVFPVWQEIMPKEFSQACYVNARDFAAALNKVNVMSDADARDVKLTFSEDKIRFATRAPEVGDAETHIGYAAETHRGATLEIFFNIDYLRTSAAKTETSKNLIIKYEDAERPVVIEGENCRSLIMPIG